LDYRHFALNAGLFRLPGRTTGKAGPYFAPKHPFCSPEKQIYGEVLVLLWHNWFYHSTLFHKNLDPDSSFFCIVCGYIYKLFIRHQTLVNQQ